MNASKKTKSFDGIPRVRKRNSTSYKPASQNGVQGRASLLKNNKTLAVTLQETRCQLSDYKAFFEESFECMSKVKIAKSKMVQLSTALKDFVKIFDETLASMEFDDSKWTNFKASTQSSKSFENEMNPVMEVADEASDQKMSCDDENSECSTTDIQSQEIVEGRKEDPKISFESPQKEEEKHNSQIGEAKENMDVKTKMANQPSQTVKVTRIPRCNVLTVNLKSRKESKQKNKVSKRMSHEKNFQESVPDFCRRKTFVVKNSNILVDSEPKDNVLGTTVENVVNEDEITDIPHDTLILKNDKRKTFVKKSSEVVKNPADLNSIQNKEGEIGIVKATAMQEDDLISKNDKRKTFVKKSNHKIVFDQNIDYQTSIPSMECTSADSERAALETGNGEIGHHSVKLSPDLQQNNKRKTFFKTSSHKTVFDQSNENQTSIPNGGECTSADSERATSETGNGENGHHSENFKLSPDLQQNNKRKTCVKKSSHKTVFDQSNENQTCTPNGECTSADSERATSGTGNGENGHHSENFKLSPDLQPYVCLSEIDDAFCKNRPNSLGELKPVEAFISVNADAAISIEEMKKINKMPSGNEPLNSENKTKQDITASKSPSKEIQENGEMPIVFEPSSSGNKVEQDVMNKAAILDNCLELFDSDSEKICVGVRQASRCKNYKAFLESSDSECEEIPVIESFHEKKKTFETTPVRKQITHQKRKFVFDAKKRKSVLKSESVCKIRKSEIDSNYLGGKISEFSDTGVSKASCGDENDVNNCAVKDTNAVHVRLDDLAYKGHADSTNSDADKVSKKRSKTKKIKDASAENAHCEKRKADKRPKIKNTKKNPLKNDTVKNLSPPKQKTKKKNMKLSDFDDSILKYSEEDNFTRETVFECNAIDKTEEEHKADFPCKKTGVNTFLVQAEIHPPPPPSKTPCSVEDLNKENQMLNLQNMQVSVVLEDVFKSCNIEFLKLDDKNSLCQRTVAPKIPLSAATNNIAIDPNESIEKMRSDEDANHSDLQSDALLDVGKTRDLHADAVPEPEKPRSRRRKEVNYKERPLNSKMRRC